MAVKNAAKKRSKFQQKRDSKTFALHSKMNQKIIGKDLFLMLKNVKNWAWFSASFHKKNQSKNTQKTTIFPLQNTLSPVSNRGEITQNTPPVSRVQCPNITHEMLCFTSEPRNYRGTHCTNKKLNRLLAKGLICVYSNYS